MADEAILIVRGEAAPGGATASGGRGSAASDDDGERAGQRLALVPPASGLLDAMRPLAGGIGNVLSPFLQGIFRHTMSIFAATDRIAMAKARSIESQEKEGTQGAQNIAKAFKPTGGQAFTAGMPQTGPSLGRVKAADVDTDVQSGSMAEMAAGAGAALAIVAAAKYAEDKIAGAATSIVTAPMNVGATVANANADPAQQLQQMGQTIQDSAIGPFKVLGTVVGGTVQSVGKFSQALDGMVGRLGQLNPQIAIAQAMADVRQTLNDMRRGQEVAPQLVRYIEAKAQLQERFEDIKIQALKKLVPMLSKALELMENGFANTEKVLEVIDPFLDALSNLPIYGELLTGIRDLLRPINRTGTNVVDPNIRVLRDRLFNELGVP